MIVETIRWAEPDEARTLQELQRRSSLVWESTRPDLLVHPEVIEAPGELIERRQVRVAVGAGRIVGFSAVVPGADGEAELDGLFVEPECMGAGVGRSLALDAVETARAAGRRSLVVTANTNALGFYERIGFVATGAVATRFEPAVRMHLPILPAVASAEPILTRRLSLEVLDAGLLTAMLDGARASGPFAWPDWWPDDVDRHHLAFWRQRAPELDGHDAWRPRAVVDRRRNMVGHAGFHLPPRPLEAALSDPTFRGTKSPSPGGAVEIGYTTFPEARRNGYATETAAALVDWAYATGEVTTILATTAEENEASKKVLERAGFESIGSCKDEEGTEEQVYRSDMG